MQSQCMFASEFVLDCRSDICDGFDGASLDPSDPSELSKQSECMFALEFVLDCRSGHF